MGRFWGRSSSTSASRSAGTKCLYRSTPWQRDEFGLSDQLRLTALEAEDRLPLPMLDAIQRAADLLEELGWEIQPSSGLL